MFLSSFSVLCIEGVSLRPESFPKLQSAKRISDPPDPKEKAAGKAGTFRSGAFHSWTAILIVYGNEESGASVKFAGGAI
jgi:hypothetical protein